MDLNNMTSLYPDFTLNANSSFDCVINNIDHTEIRASTLHGFGLLATRYIAAGHALATMDGQIIGHDFYQKIKCQWLSGRNNETDFFLELNYLPEKKLLVRMLRTKYSYINHSRLPNCKLIGYPPTIWSIKNIDAGEELTLDYRDEPLPINYLRRQGETYL